MPIPAGQNCGNCQYWDTSVGSPGPGDIGQCRYIYPTFETPNWVNVKFEDWCQNWATIGTAGGGGSGNVQVYDSAAGYRGFNQTGDVLSLTTTWQTLTPTFAAVTGAINWTLQSPGVMQLSYTTFTPTPTFSIYTTAYAVCVFRSNSNNEDVELTFAINGTTDTTYTVNAGLRFSGEAIPVPTIAGLQLADQDTVELQARTPTGTASVDLVAYHLLFESYRVLSF